MKKILLNCAAFIFCAGVANAADLPAKAPIYRAASAYNWSGLYGGVSGGYAWGENKISDGAIAGGTVNKYEPAGGFGGVQFGYNSQFAPHWLIGGEVDISGGKIDDSLNPGVGTGKDEFNAFGTARTRFGYVQDRWLVYGTAGAIWLRDRYKTKAAGTTITDNMQYHVGWVFGGGIEYAVDNRWSWKFEYLYAPLDRSHDNKGLLSLQTDASFNILRVGLNYRFGDDAAPASYMSAEAAAPRSNWAGSYLGLHGGYGWGTVHEVYSPAKGTATFKPDGGYGGFQGGYNWLFAPNALLGVEVDTSFGDLKDSAVFSGGAAGTAKIDDLGTARLRLGYLMTPDTLLYVTGGAAYAREKSTTAGVTGFNTKVDHLGWTIGGGVEYKFAPEWSLKAEYLYADLGDFKANVPFVVGVTRTSDMTLNTVRVGINYSGPVIERFFGGR